MIQLISDSILLLILRVLDTSDQNHERKSLIPQISVNEKFSIAYTNNSSLNPAIRGCNSIKTDFSCFGWNNSQIKIAESFIFRNNKVLLTDSNVKYSELFGRMLSTKYGYDVEIVGDGFSLIDLILSENSLNYEIIFLNSYMPGMNGLQTIYFLRKFGYKGIVIGLVDNIHSKTTHEFKKMGCNEVLEKPLSVKEFEKSIVSILNIIK